MSNLLKSKFLLGVMVVAVMVAGVVAVNAKTASAATCTISTTLRVGSKGAQVQCLQAALDNGIVADGSFGPKTKARVIAWQASMGLTADGVFGPKSRAMLMTGGVVTPPTSSNCQPGWLFNPLTSLPCSTTPPVTNAGPVSVTLASDNPAAGTIVSGQATADLAHFAFTGTGTVSSITLTRTGISDQNTLSNVYLYDGNVRLTDGYSFNNSGVLTMNGLNLAVNGTRVISVKADVGSCPNGTSCYSLGVNLTGLMVAGGTAVTTNVAGNVMFIATGTSIATVTIDSATQTVGQSGSVLCTSTCPTVNTGTSGYTVWSDNMNIGSRAVWFKGANFRIVGSAPTNALTNVRLYVDGVAVGTPATMGTISGSTYAMFDFAANPISLTTGGHTLDVRADIAGGSSYTVQVSLQQASDLVIFDPQVGVNIIAQKTAGVAFVAVSAGTITINAGSASVVVDPAFSAMTNITGGATNIDIGKFKVHGYSEDVKVSSLSVTPKIINATAGTCSTDSVGAPTNTCGLSNVALYFNGSQVGSSVNWVSGSGAISFNLGSQMIIPAGADSTIEIRADMQTTGSVNYTVGTVNATINVGSGNGQGQTSHTTLNFPASSVVGTSLIVQTGTLAVSKNSSYTNQVINPNTANVKGGSFVLANQSSSESVHVTNLSFALAFTAPTFTLSGSTITTGASTLKVSSTTGFTVGNRVTFAANVATADCTVTAVTDTVTLAATCVAAKTGVDGATITGTGATSGPATLTNLSNLRTSETSGSGANPVLPTATNNFSVDFVIAPGAVKTIDLLYDVSTSNFGAVTPTLTVTSLGMNSHVSITQTGAGTGQTITFGAGTLNTPTVVTSSSTQGQNIAGGTTAGVTNASVATFNVTATNGTATISELKFKNTGTSGTVTGVTVGSVFAPTVADIAYLTGLSIVVPNGGAGMNLNAFSSYAPVGSTGVASGGTAVLQLCSIKYTIGGTTTTSGDTTCGSPLLSSGQTMTLVGSKPIVTVSQPVGSILAASSNVEAIDVTVSADTAGPITINGFDLTSTLSAGAGSPQFTATQITVKDASNNNVPVLTASACTAAATCALTGAAQIVFGSGVTPAGYLLNAGQSQTFKIFLPVNTLGGTGTLPNTFMNTHLTSGTTQFSWTDTAGSASVAQTTTANIFQYPSTTTFSIHN